MWSREGLREYVGGALWVWPSIASIVALVLGLAVSQISAGTAGFSRDSR